MRTMNDALASLARTDVDSWDRYLPSIAFGYNTSIHEATGYTPYTLNTGREVQLPEELEWNDWKYQAKKGSSTHQHFIDVTKRLQEIRESARDRLTHAWRRQKQRYDAKRTAIKLNEGDLVLVRLSDRERAAADCPKLGPRWSKPARISNRLSNEKTYEVEFGDGQREIVNIHRLLPVTADAWWDTLAAEPKQEELEEPQKEEVDTAPAATRKVKQAAARAERRERRRKNAQEGAVQETPGSVVTSANWV